MPQKKAKKAPKKILLEKAKKPTKSAAKPAKAGVISAALKTAAKTVTKNLALVTGKKPLLAKKNTAPAVEKPIKKLEPTKKLEAVKKLEPAKKLEPVKKAVVPPPVKAKKPESAPVAGAVAVAVAGKALKKEDAIPKKVAKPAELPKAKAGKEVVVEVPAPKGVALLAKEGKTKKNSKAAEAAAAKLKRCREPGCEHDTTLVGYCRMHYIKNWRRIKRKESILASGQLNNYVEELVNKYPDKYLDVIRQDLATEKEWGKVVVDLELEATEEEGSGDEEIDTMAEGVRPATTARGEFDDDGDAF